MQSAYLALLEGLGAGRMSHSRGSLLDHLRNTHDLLRAWGNDPEVCLAGGFHSVYGTYVYDGRAAGLDERGKVREVIGERAERLVYLFCVTDRSTYYDQLKGDPPQLRDLSRNETVEIDAATLAALIEMEAANMVEQLPRRSAKKAARAARWYGDAFASCVAFLSPAAMEAATLCFQRALAGSLEPAVGDPPMGTLAMLHTAATHVDTFAGLSESLAPDVPIAHEVRADLLERARIEGADAATVRRDLAAALRDLVSAGADLVLCTCSTIGGTAESVGAEQGIAVLRVDRAMAERAVAIGPGIVIVAALASTVAPTGALLEEVAGAAGRTVRLRTVLLEDAWPRFEAGDMEGYLDAVARGIESIEGADVVVLAQASMAGALARCGELPMPVLSSPRLGVSAALERLARRAVSAPAAGA